MPEPTGDTALSPCPNCGADWRRTELVSEAHRGGGYRVECHECGHRWDDRHASHHARETARRLDRLPQPGTPSMDLIEPERRGLFEGLRHLWRAHKNGRETGA